MRWAIYARISVDKGSRGDDGDTISLETQEDGCRALIAGLDPDAVILEPFVLREVWTGIELFPRPKLSRLREAVRRREVDAIACYQPKRWTRDPEHAGYLMTELREHRVLLRFAVDDPGEGEAGALVGYVHHWTGKQEHKDIAERTHRARTKMVHLGRAWIGCKAPYGLRWKYRTVERPGGRQEMEPIGWEEDPLTGPVVRRLYAQALAGASLRSLAQTLTAQGLPSPKGREGWSHVSVRYILTQTVYTGEAYGLRYETDKTNQYVGVRGASTGRWKSRQQVRPREAWVKLPDGYAPRLVEPTAWEAVQQLLRGNHRAGRKPRDPASVLMAGGRARCAHCGSALTLVSNKPPALMCSGRTSWRNCTSRPYIRAESLDTAALTLARRIFEHPDVIAGQAALHRQQDPTMADLEMVEHTLQEIEQRMQAIAAVAQQIRTPEAAAPLALQLETLAEQQRRAQQDRRDLLARRAGWEASQQFLDGFAGLCARVRQRLDGFGRAEWQQAIDALGITAVVQRAPAPDRFALSTRLDSVMTESLIRQLVPDLEALGCQLLTTASS